MDEPLRTLFFMPDGRGRVASRLQVAPEEAGTVIDSVCAIRARLRSGVEAIAALSACARARTKPPLPLEYEANRALDDLERLARVLGDLEEVLTGRRLTHTGRG